MEIHILKAVIANIIAEDKKKIAAEAHPDSWFAGFQIGKLMSYKFVLTQLNSQEAA